MKRNNYTSKLTERLELRYDSQLKRQERAYMVNTLVQDLNICEDESVTIAFYDQSSSKPNKGYRLNKHGIKNTNMSNADNKTDSN